MVAPFLHGIARFIALLLSIPAHAGIALLFSIPAQARIQFRVHRFSVSNLARLIALSFSLFTFHLSPASAADNLDLTATVDNTSPKVGERLIYTVTLVSNSTSSMPDIQPPDFEGFEIVGGPSTSTSVQIVNMSVSKSSIVTYAIRPTKPGTLTIAPATVKVRNRTTQSNSITLEVLPTGSASQQGGQSGQSGGSRSAPDPDGGSDKLPELFLTATTDKSTLTKLDMAVVTYKLYLRVNVLNYEIAKIPQATGFWIEEFQTSARPTLEDVTIRGQAYKVATIRKVGVFPTRPGKLVLDPLTLDLTVERATRRRSRDPFESLFDDPFMGRGQRTVQSVSCDPLTLNVLDFPSGAPGDFNGDVGQYDMTVTYDKRELSQNDALTVKVTVSGRGYLKSVDAPKLSLPSGFEQFAPTSDESVSLVGETMRGKKSFTYLVIPRRSGNFNLPPVTFSYFEPSTGRYKSIQDGGIALFVSAAAPGSEPAYTGRSASEVTLLDSDIRFVKSLTGPLYRKTVPPYGSPLFLFLVALWPALFVGGIGWEKYNERRLADPVAVRRRKASELMRKALLEADKFARQNATLNAAETAAKGLAELVGSIIREPAAGLTSDLVRKRLGEMAVETELVESAVRLLGEADRIRFGGGSTSADDLEGLVDRFRKTAESLEKLK